MSKIKNTFLCLFLLFLSLALIYLFSVRSQISKFIMNLPVKPPAAQTSMQVNRVGEKITYEVRLGKLYLGKAQFNNLDNVLVNGRLLGFMAMDTKLTRFSDSERIYSDLQTLLPIRVERDISKLFGHEKITEDYDQNNFLVTIVKNSGSKQEKLIIKKNSVIHNAVLLPYYVRRIPKLDIGRIIIANLPTRRLEVKLVTVEDIKVPAGTFKAYHFKSTPKQIEIWISVDERRIPLKILGNGFFGYSMAMSEYKFDK